MEIKFVSHAIIQIIGIKHQKLVYLAQIIIITIILLKNVNAVQKDLLSILQDFDAHVLEIHHTMIFRQKDVFNATYHLYGIQRMVDVLIAQLYLLIQMDHASVQKIVRSSILQKMHVLNAQKIYQFGMEKNVWLVHQILIMT